MSLMLRRVLTASLFLLFCFSILSFEAVGQVAIQGRITVFATGEPLEGAQVYISRLKRGTIADQTGHFEIAGLDPGEYTLEFSYLGYSRLVHRVSVEMGISPMLDIQLEPTTLESKGVVIISDDPRGLGEIPLSTLSLSKSERLTGGAASLWEALDALPGMARTTNGPGIEQPVIRGLSGGRILLLMQHLPYRYQTWDPESGLAMNGNDAEQVDVILGPSTVRYGPGAMGGVVSIAPEYPAPLGQTVGSFSGGFASNGEALNGELSLKGTSATYFWGARGGYASHADYRAGGDFELDGFEPKNDEEKGKVPNSRFDHAQMQAFGGVSRAWGSSRVSYQFFSHRNGIVEAEEEEEEGEEKERKIGPPYHWLRNHSVTSDTHVRLGSGWLHSILGAQINMQQEFEPAEESISGEEGEAALDLLLTTLHLKVEYETKASENLTITPGFQASLQENESEGGEPFIPNSNRLEAGAFGLIHWKQGPLVVEAGLRYDYQSIETSPAESEEADAGMGAAEPAVDGPDGAESEINRTFNTFSGSVGATYTAGPGRFVKVNIGAGGRAPDVAELTANGLLREIRRYLVGETALDAERNMEGDVTIGWRNQVVTLSGGVFLNQISDFIYVFANGQTVDSFPIYLYRQGDTVFRGGHAGATFHPSAFRGARLFTRFDYVEARLSGTAGDDIPMIPAPSFSTGLELVPFHIGVLKELSPRIELEHVFQQDHTASWESGSDAYTLINVSVNAQLPWQSHSLHIGLHGRNIFNTQYVSHLSLLKPDGIPDPGRSLSLMITVPF